MNWRGWMDRLHRLAARRYGCARLAVALRNQADCVIAWHLGEGADSALNGEYRLLCLLAPEIGYFVDVGANVGDWSAHLLTLARPEAQGLLVEPSRETFQELTRRLEQEPRVSLLAAALSDRPGELTFHDLGGCGETSSLVPSAALRSGSAYPCRVSTLDAEMERLGWKEVDFLKIDCEGYDAHILRGASGLLRQGRIRFIQFEYNTGWAQAGSTLHGTMQDLKDRDYSVFLVRSTGLHPFNYDRWGEYFRYSNFFAVRRDSVVRVQSLIRSEI